MGRRLEGRDRGDQSYGQHRGDPPGEASVHRALMLSMDHVSDSGYPVDALAKPSMALLTVTPGAYRDGRASPSLITSDE